MPPEGLVEPSIRAAQSGIDEFAGWLLDASIKNNSTGVNVNRGEPWEKVKICGIVAVCFLVICCVFTRINFAPGTSSMHRKYLIGLVPTHLVIGCFCVFTAFNHPAIQNWQCAPPLKYFIMVVVMGLMQGVQVQLAADDYQEQQHLRNSAEDSSLRIPSAMPARFQCKTMDGVLEGTVFSFVAMYALLKNGVSPRNDGVVVDEYCVAILYFSAFCSFLTIGLALMEVDYRVSAAMQRLLNASSYTQLLHLLFRASEVALRLITLLVFCSFMRMIEHPIITYLPFGLLVVDYLFGVALLLCCGGREPMREASILLGIPLMLTNVMQFVDTPGMSLQAQRMTTILLPFRFIELLGVLVFCTFGGAKIKANTDANLDPWEFLWKDHTEWLVAWSSCGISYYVLLFLYAIQVKPEADLHAAVANGDMDVLKQLLQSSELVLDINRYGPDGRTPLHLAALRSQVSCMKLLVEQKANVNARTGDAKNQTALHLSVMHKDTAATHYLCAMCGGDAPFLNAVNSDGDTALHVAARKQNVGALKELLQIRSVDLKIRNANGQMASDCAPSDKFGFDRDSNECAITEIFRQAEAGTRPVIENSGVEMSSQASTASGRQYTKETSGETEVSASSSASPPPHWQTQTPPDEQHVPLVQLSPEAEAKFLARQQELSNTNRSGSMINPVTNCGISSFMLSAGMGALSRAFLNSIKEDEETSGDPETAQVKASFDDFQEVKPIGEGAFGKVILVKHRGSDELFAMKLMDKAKFKAQKITSKAISEQYILKTTRFPFIVMLQYAFQGSTFWALVMEYCPNGDLQDLLVRKGAPGLSLFECARLGGETLLALEHLHRIMVIFRDLKLENVVLCPKMRAKLTDFGLAKKLYNVNDARTMCGSYGYAAPEIMLNAGRYSYSVDLYSFGVMMYMLLSGGDKAPNNPKQRLPPMRHNSLRRKLKEIDKNPPGEWAQPHVHGMVMLDALTSEDSKARKTSTEMKDHPFFLNNLGFKVDKLLEEKDKSYLES